MVKFVLIIFVLLQFSACGGGGGGDINHMESVPIAARDELEKTLVARPALLMPRDASISNQKCIQDITESKEIIFKKGIYCFKGNNYNMSTEGLFRIFDFQNGLSRQLIVYESDVFRLLSSFAWIVKHGSGDDGYYPDNIDVLRGKLINSNLSLTCGPLSFLFNKILNEMGIKSRIVSFSRDSNFNGFDDGHVVLEIMIRGKWTLVDLDNNIIFMTTNLQTISALQIALQPIYLESRLIIAGDSEDFLNFRDGSLNYSFYGESRQLGTWYNELMRVVSIDGKYFCPEYRNCSSFHKNRPELALIPEAEFIKLFYSDGYF